MQLEALTDEHVGFRDGANLTGVALHQGLVAVAEELHAISGKGRSKRVHQPISERVAPLSHKIALVASVARVRRPLQQHHHPLPRRRITLRDVELLQEELPHGEQLPGVVHGILAAALHRQPDFVGEYVSMDHQAFHRQADQRHHRSQSLQTGLQTSLRGSLPLLRVAANLCTPHLREWKVVNANLWLPHHDLDVRIFQKE
jgi:hypothetical protein